MFLQQLRRWAKIVIPCMFVTGCAGFQRGCTSWSARNLGSDWIIVQYDMGMHPKMCWKLHNVSVANEENSDGIHWFDNNTNAMRHIGGWYDYAQVPNGDYADAATRLGVDPNICHDGPYAGSAQ
jgi:hypothetical protein